ncbi:MAG: glycosyltransferase family 2 protein [Cyanobacteria bacterium J06598_1]
MAAPLISAIICTHNREEYLGAAIDSLLSQTDLLSQAALERYEIIVVDNASTDSTAAIARSYAENPKFRYVHEPTLGLSVARNRGAQEAQGEILAYLDDDAEASAEWLSTLLGVFEAEEKIAIAGGKVTLIWPPGAEPPRWLSDDLASGLGAYDLGDELIYIEQPSLTPRGLNYAVRKSFLNAVGGFDTHLGRVGKNLLSNEEQQLTRLALDREQKVAYVPTALAAHNVAPARMKPGWFLSRSWWQGISESYREQSCGSTGLWQLRSGGERLVRGLYKSVKYIGSPSLRFENLAYAYGQLAYLGSVSRHLLKRQPPNSEEKPEVTSQPLL